MRRHRLIPALLPLLLLMTVVAPAGAHHRGDPHFRDLYCDKTDYQFSWDQDPISRRDALNYASTAIGDGYQWGGGCWNGNGVDDQPNDPPRDATTGGEGGDCSGFVFKTWRLRTNTKHSGFQSWPMLKYIHGPYTASSFRGATAAPLERIGRHAAAQMDAFASTTHVGMIWADHATPDGQDLIVEAANERDGTGVWARTYRSNSNYRAVGRKNWHVVSVGCIEYCGWVVYT